MMSLPLERRKYTHEDYLSWPEDERIEIIKGIPYYTYGAPIAESGPVTQAIASQKDQGISLGIARQLYNFLKGKPCKLFEAPFAVTLPAQDGEVIAVNPDLFVVCDCSKLDRRCCNGAPDLVIEIISPSTAREKRVVKFQLYLDRGVREYWLVDPETDSVQVCTLQSGKYLTKIYDHTMKIPVSVLPGCTVNLREVFHKG